MKLNYRKYGNGEPLFILHGVFGSSDNWLTVGKKLADHFQVYLIDLRNHGLSPHSSDMNYALMAEDVKELMVDSGLSKINILGHSMGGKVAMDFATSYAEKVVKLVVVDISPKAYPPHHSQIFKGFHSIDLSRLESRKQADTQLTQVIKDFGVRQFMLKNLQRTEDGFSWKINLQGIERNIDKIGMPLAEDRFFDKETLFIAGGKSDYISKNDELLISKHFPKSEIIVIENAGHWVHAENPESLKSQVLKFLS